MMLLSTFLGPDKTPQPAEVNKAVPWFWGHGDADPIVPFAMGKWTSQQLAKVREQRSSPHLPWTSDFGRPKWPLALRAAKHTCWIGTVSVVGISGVSGAGSS